MRMFFLRTVMVLLEIRERRIVVPQAAHLAVSSAPPACFDPGNMHSRALRSLLAVPDAPPRFIDPGNMHSRALQALLAVPDAPPRFIAHWARSAPIPQGALGSDPTGRAWLRSHGARQAPALSAASFAPRLSPKPGVHQYHITFCTDFFTS